MEFLGSLHNHTMYSNLKLRDSIIRPEELIDYAIELGQEVIAITEHETICNALKVEKYYNKIKEKNPEFKVIFGNEIYLCRDGLNGQNFDKETDRYYHFILLAKNAEGHRQIRELSTRAWNRSYVTSKMRRVPTYYQDLLDVVATNPGNIIAATACLGGFLDTKILQWVRNGRDSNFYQQIISWIYQMENIFGKGNFFLELQPSNTEDQIIVNKELLILSEKTGVPYIITTDTHYLKKEDAPIHEAFLKSQDGDREVASFYESTYLMGTEEIEKYLSYLTREQLDKAYENISSIKNVCEDYSFRKPLKIPTLITRKYTSTIAEVESFYDRIPYLKTFMESNFEGNRIMCHLIIDKLKK